MRFGEQMMSPDRAAGNDRFALDIPETNLSVLRGICTRQAVEAPGQPIEAMVGGQDPGTDA